MALFGSPYMMFRLILIALLFSICFAADPFAYFELELSYITASPLGVPQQVIAVNGMFPGPTLNVTTNYDVVVNVNNNLDEDLLVTWPGVKMLEDSWQDGVLGTTCPIPAKWNWTYQFQVKDQIGSFFYSPSLNLQRASGGFRSFVITDQDTISLPFKTPDGDIVIIIGDWCIRNHKALRTALDAGNDLGMPDGVLINGKGPYQFNTSLVPGGIDYETINVEPGKTYLIRIRNVGVSTSLNFRIQNRNLFLVETEGSYTVQQKYTSMDIHVGQSYAFLVNMDQNASSDYYIVASPRFVNESVWQRVTGVAILHYSNSNGKASGSLPVPPNDQLDKTFSMNQARSIRWNVSASGARPNPLGSFQNGSINATQVYVLKNQPAVTINGKRRTTLSGISFVNPSAPIMLGDQFQLTGVYKLDFPSRPITGPPKMETSIINGTHKGLMELIFQNNDTNIQSYHVDGYAFFVLGMYFGEWIENSKGTYKKWDGIARSTTQVLARRVLALLAFLLSSSSVAAGSDDSEQLWSIATNSWEKEPSLTTLAVGLTLVIFLGVCVFIFYLLLFAPQAATGPVPAVAQPMVPGSVAVLRVLDQKEIELFPLLSFQSDNTVGFGESNCVICFDEFVDRGNVRALPCGHIFHPDCIDSWLTSKSTKCPVCRRDYSG